MKLVHAADLHLDSPMHGLAAYETAPTAELRLATRVALRNLVDLTIDEGAAVLLIAGDLHDGDWHDFATGAHVAREMQRLQEADVRVVVVTGNHDAASRITRSLRMPANVTVLPDDAPGTVVFEDLGLAVHGQGYATQAVLEDLSAGYPAPLPGLLNVGLLHTSADGRPGHERYAPCRIERLAAHGYDLWALGHIHERELLHADPPILFPGCLQGRHVREAGPKGATIVEAGAGGLALDARVLDHVRWAVCEIDAASLADEDAVVAALEDTLRQAVTAADGRLLAARVRVTGASPAHAALVRAGTRLDWEVRSMAAEVAGDGVWIERVAVATRPEHEPDGGDEVLAGLAGALREARADATVMADLAGELAALTDRLPAAVLDGWDLASPAVLGDLVAELEHTLPARLLSGGGAS